jgi:hypothetical protein
LEGIYINKKIVGLVLAGALALGITGCSNSKEETKANVNTSTAKEQVSAKKDINDVFKSNEEVPVVKD